MGAEEGIINYGGFYFCDLAAYRYISIPIMVKIILSFLPSPLHHCLLFSRCSYVCIRVRVVILSVLIQIIIRVIDKYTRMWKNILTLFIIVCFFFFFLDSWGHLFVRMPQWSCGDVFLSNYGTDCRRTRAFTQCCWCYISCFCQWSSRYCVRTQLKLQINALPW